GIALTNIGDTAFRWHCTFPADRYALPTEGRVYLINPHGRRLLGRYSEGQIQLDYLLQPREACVLEMTGK
nr:hypothetical protein [bacterium]